MGPIYIHELYIMDIYLNAKISAYTKILEDIVPDFQSKMSLVCNTILASSIIYMLYVLCYIAHSLQTIWLNIWYTIFD